MSHLQTSNMMLSTVLGPDVASRIAAAKLLVVGAGGIGCETLKNLVMHGFRHIHVVDLDTIDATNLNRQFLFRKHHVDASKAQVACETVRKFGNVMMGPALGKVEPSTATSTGGTAGGTRKGEARQEVLHLEAHHGDVKTFDSEFFEQFDFVLNCLDNMSARHHVNRVCVALKKPLLEAGTTGHAGQTTVHVPHHTECYECMARPKPQKFPVCTIRKTPDKFIHCVTWAKNLFDALFSAPPAPSGEQMNPAEEVDHDSGDMMSDLRDDRLLRVSSEEETLDAAVALVDKLFGGDIQALYDSGEIANTWKGNRPRPKVLRTVGELLAPVLVGGGDTTLDGDMRGPRDQSNHREKVELANGAAVPNFVFKEDGHECEKENAFRIRLVPDGTRSRSPGAGGAGTLCMARVATLLQKEKASRTWAEDQQRVWCLETTIVKLLNSILAVKKRLKAEPATSVAFRKEDDAAVDFVTAVSNLRALNYSIFPLKTKWEVTSMAGNIVPAIATTNAIVAGLQVANLVHLIVGASDGASASSSSSAVGGHQAQPRLLGAAARPATSAASSSCSSSSGPSSSPQQEQTSSPRSFNHRSSSSFRFDRTTTTARDCFCQYPEPFPSKRLGRLLLKPSKLIIPPNKNCLVCSSDEGGKVIRLALSRQALQWSVAKFVEVVVKGHLHFHEPGVMLTSVSIGCSDGSGVLRRQEAFAQIYDPAFPVASEEAASEGIYPEKELRELVGREIPAAALLAPNEKSDPVSQLRKFTLSFSDESQLGLEIDAHIADIVDEANWDEEKYPEHFAVVGVGAGSGGAGLGGADGGANRDYVKIAAADGDDGRGSEAEADEIGTHLAAKRQKTGN